MNFWTSPWQAAGQLLDGASAAGKPTSEQRSSAPSEGRQIDENLQSFVAFHTENGMAMARTFFPDHTVVKFELPMPNLALPASHSKAFCKPY